MSRRVARAAQVGGDHQFYPTPDWCVDVLLREIGPMLPPGPWLEPCAGDGAIIRAVNAWADKSGHDRPAWSAAEIREEARPLLEPLTATAPLIGDFLHLARKIDQDWRAANGSEAPKPFRVAISNPPFELAREMIQAARLVADTTIMLVRIALLESDGRAEWMRGTGLPTAIYVLPNRPSFVLGKTDNSAYAWFLWADSAEDRRPTSGPRTAALRVLEAVPASIRKAARRT